MNTTSNLSELMQSYYDKSLLHRASEVVVLQPLGQKRDLPKYNGKTITWTRYSNLAVASTALTEGTNPSGSNLSATNVSATIAEYGDFVKIASLVSLTALDPELKEKAAILGDQMAETVDGLISAVLAAGATEQIVSTQSTQSAITATDILTIKDVRLAVRAMQNNKARKYGDGYFVLVVDPDTHYDIQSDSNWVNSAIYSETTRLHTGEVGKWYGTRVIMTTKPFRSSVDNNTYSASGACHHNLMMGQDAFGVTKLSGYEKAMIVKTPGPQDTSNALDMYGTAGWKIAFVSKVLNANYIRNIKTGATA